MSADVLYSSGVVAALRGDEAFLLGALVLPVAAEPLRDGVELREGVPLRDAVAAREVAD